MYENTLLQKSRHRNGIFCVIFLGIFTKPSEGEGADVEYCLLASLFKTWMLHLIKTSFFECLFDQKYLQTLSISPQLCISHVKLHPGLPW